MATTRLGGWGGPRLPFGSFAGKSAPVLVSVPDITGLSQEDAETALVAEGLVLGAVTEANSDTVAAGLVISQNPAAGANVASGSSVDIVASLGAAVVAAAGGFERPRRRLTLPRRERPVESDDERRQRIRAAREALGIVEPVRERAKRQAPEQDIDAPLPTEADADAVQARLLLVLEALDEQTEAQARQAEQQAMALRKRRAAAVLLLAA